MKLVTLKPLYLGGKVVVEGRSFETHEQHARELIAKGYAALDDSDVEPVLTLEEEPVAPALSLTSDQLSAATLEADPEQKPAGAKKRKAS